MNPKDLVDPTVAYVCKQCKQPCLDIGLFPFCSYVCLCDWRNTPAVEPEPVSLEEVVARH